MNTLVKLTIAITLSIFGLTDSHAQWGNKKIVGNGNVTTNTVKTSDYDAIKGVGSMDIHLEKGSEGNITVTTDENLQQHIEVYVEGSTLIIKTKKNTYLKTKKGIHVTVPFHDISKVALVGSGDIDSKDTIDARDLEVKVTGSGDVELDLKASNVDVTVTGSGDIELTGSTTDLEVSVTGSGDFKGFGLEAQNTDAKVSGSGDAKVVAKQNIKARVNGSGDIAYKGNPERKDTKTSGSGDITAYK